MDSALLWRKAGPLFLVDLTDACTEMSQTGLALVDIVGLTGSVFYLTKILHEPTEGKSTYLLAPYCVWLSLATYLNAGIWWFNRGRTISKRD